MSIPDTNLLKFTLELDCGHKRTTMFPIKVGDSLPCLDESHKLEQHEIVSIVNSDTGREAGPYEMGAAQSMHARMLNSHSKLNRQADALPWWRWRRRRKLREDATVLGLAGATIGLGLKKVPRRW